MRRLALLLLLAAGGAEAAERRCGWFVNPTPGNMWLEDRDGLWVLGAQGGHQAEGTDRLPDMARGGWVATNGSYGHGCACLVVETDRTERLILRLHAAEPLPLSRCRTDRSLPRRRD
jgi:hypothetical protein